MPASEVDQMDRKILYLLDELETWWKKAHAELRSPVFRGPDSEKDFMDACNLVASATKKLKHAEEKSFLLERINKAD